MCCTRSSATARRSLRSTRRWRCARAICDALNNRGNALLSLNRPQEALASFEQLLARNPRHGEALHQPRQRARRARPHRTRRWPISTPRWRWRRVMPAALYNRGNALLDARPQPRRSPPSIARWPRAPATCKAWNNRGRALQALNRHAEAVASFGKAIALQKDYADAHFNRALALLTLGDLRPRLCRI